MDNSSVAYIPLSRLLSQIKFVLDSNFGNKEYLILAEIGKISTPPNSKHAYLELIEAQDDKTICSIQGTLWSENKNKVFSQFKTFNVELKPQIKTVFRVNVSYSVQFGLSLNILDIDVTYILGDLEKQKIETIAKLKTDNLFFQNKNLQFPLLPKRIAVISSENSSGYKDFSHTLTQNPYKFVFQTTLFPTLMQGKDAIDSIIQNLREIFKQKDNFDLIVITRGGGSKTDLEFFNSLTLCNAICRMNLPVITGLGHTPDESVLDMIANQQRNTPTDAAKFLIDKYLYLLSQLIKSKEIITRSLQDILNKNKSKLVNTSTRYFISTQEYLRHIREIVSDYKNTLGQSSKIVKSNSSVLNNLKLKFEHSFFTFIVSKNNTTNKIREDIYSKSQLFLNDKKNELNNTTTLLEKLPEQIIENESRELIMKVKLLQTNINFMLNDKANHIASIGKSLKQLDPINVLKRGYSITFQNGKALKSSLDANEDQEIITKLHSGEIASIIKSKK